MKKLTALMLCLVMLFACLTGCGGTTNTEATPEPTAEATAEPTDAPEETPAATAEPVDYYAMYLPAYETRDPDEVVMTIDGSDVTWGEYFYWLAYYAIQLQSYIGDIEDWTADMSAMGVENTYEGYIKSYVVDALTSYHTVDVRAKAESITLDEDLQQKVDESYDNILQTYGEGDEEKLDEYLKTEFITPATFELLQKVPYYYQQIFRNTYGNDGEKLSEADVLAYANDNGYMHCKHILFMPTDSEGNELSDEDFAAKRKQADEILTELRACTDNVQREELFDKYMTELSEDPGVAYYPDGYVFTPGSMVSEFETAAGGLEDYGVSDIVESSYGIHIIMRLPISADDTDMSTSATLRSAAAQAIFGNVSNEWFENAKVTYADGFESLSFNELMAKLAK